MTQNEQVLKHLLDNKKITSLEAVELYGIMRLVERLEKVFIYRLARDYGLISEDKKDIIFYFEEKEK